MNEGVRSCGGRVGRGLALMAAVGMAVAPMTACTAQPGSGRSSTIRISGPGPEIAVGALMVVGGVALARDAGTGEDQYNLQQTVFLIGVGVAVVGAVLVGHGVYRLTRPAPQPQPVAPPVRIPTGVGLGEDPDREDPDRGWFGEGALNEELWQPTTCRLPLKVRLLCPDSTRREGASPTRATTTSGGLTRRGRIPTGVGLARER